jgi:hypothetical protein
MVVTETQTHRQNRDPEIDPYMYSQQILDKAAKNTHWRQEASSVRRAGKREDSHVEY